jgi:hypothetical protein
MVFNFVVGALILLDLGLSGPTSVDMNVISELYRVTKHKFLVKLLGTRFKVRNPITKPGPYGPNWTYWTPCKNCN